EQVGHPLAGWQVGVTERERCSGHERGPSRWRTRWWWPVLAGGDGSVGDPGSKRVDAGFPRASLSRRDTVSDREFLASTGHHPPGPERFFLAAGGLCDPLRGLNLSATSKRFDHGGAQASPHRTRSHEG